MRALSVLGCLVLNVASGGWAESGTGAPAMVAQGSPTPWENCRFVPIAGRTVEASGSYWSTDLDVVNRGPGPTRISVALLNRDEDNSDATVMTVAEGLAPGATLVLDDLVTEVVPTFWRDWRGGLAVCSETGPLEVYARVQRIDETQAFSSIGFGGPGLGADRGVAPGQDGHLVGLREDDHFRTNLGLLNGGPAPADVHLVVYSTGPEPAWVLSVELQPYEQVQYESFLAEFGPEAIARGRVVVMSSAQPVFAYAVVYDRATGDPSMIPAVVVPAVQTPRRFPVR